MVSKVEVQATSEIVTRNFVCPDGITRTVTLPAHCFAGYDHAVARWNFHAQSTMTKVWEMTSRRLARAQSPGITLGDEFRKWFKFYLEVDNAAHYRVANSD